MNPIGANPANSHKLLFFVVILVACLTGMASDIYTPSIPAIAQNLGASIHLVQYSMAIYMLGVALSQLIYGPISDGVGRKAPLTIGISIMLTGSFICLFASHIDILILGRFIQGCGAGACAALWRAVFRDIFTGEELSRYGSKLVIFITFIVPATPALGGYLQHYFDWRASFVFMSLYAFIAFISILYGFKETSQHHHKEKLRLSYITNTFRQLLFSRVFMGVTSCNFLVYGAFFSWFTAGPVLLIHIVGISPVKFGWLTFCGGGSAYALSGWLNGKLVSRLGMPNMMRIGFSLMILSGIFMLGGKILIGINVWDIMGPVVLFYVGATFIWPNAMAAAFSPFGKITGYAAALYGFMQVSGAAGMGAIISHLPDTNQLPLALVMLISPLLAWLIYEVIVLK